MFGVQDREIEFDRELNVDFKQIGPSNDCAHVRIEMTEWHAKLFCSHNLGTKFNLGLFHFHVFDHLLHVVPKVSVFIDEAGNSVPLGDRSPSIV